MEINDVTKIKINPCGVIWEFYYVFRVRVLEREEFWEMEKFGFFISNWWEGFGIFFS
jgi:hypothetical protein